MFDSAPQELHHGMVFLVSRTYREIVVLGDLPGELGQTEARWHRQAEEPGFGELPHVQVSPGTWGEGP